MRSRSALLFSSFTLTLFFSMAVVACSGDDTNSTGSSPLGGPSDASVDATKSSSHDAGGSSNDANATDAPTGSDSGDVGDGGAADGSVDANAQQLVTTVGAGVTAIAVKINQGTAIGGGESTGATPSTLFDVAQNASNTETVVSA